MGAKGQNTREEIVAVTEDLILRRGFTGTSVDDILKATGLTKGAFFYHFKSKDALARAVVERYARQDSELFLGLAARADELSSDPLESTLIFLKLFEEYIEQLEKTPAGCIYASYAYEAEQFDPAIRSLVAEEFKRWRSLFAARFSAIIGSRAPKVTVRPEELANMATALIQGGLVSAKALGSRAAIIEAVSNFRRYLELLFK